MLMSGRRTGLDLDLDEVSIAPCLEAISYLLLH